MHLTELLYDLAPPQIQGLFFAQVWMRAQDPGDCFGGAAADRGLS
jgi:hypothetical protein